MSEDHASDEVPLVVDRLILVADDNFAKGVILTAPVLCLDDRAFSASRTWKMTL